MSLSKQAMWGMVAGAVIVAALFFFIGYSVGASHTPDKGAGARTGMMQGPGGFAGGQGGMRSRGGFANGTILSMTDSSITISLQNGGSQTIYLTSTTPVMKNVSGAFSDLKVGNMITVTGTPNADGSIAANSVSIRPAGTTQNPMMPAATPSTAQ